MYRLLKYLCIVLMSFLESFKFNFLVFFLLFLIVLNWLSILFDILMLGILLCKKSVLL